MLLYIFSMDELLSLSVEHVYLYFCMSPIRCLSDCIDLSYQ